MYEYVIEAIGATSVLTTVKRPVVTSRHNDSGNDTTSNDGSCTDVEDTKADTKSDTLMENLMEYRLTGLSADASYK